MGSLPPVTLFIITGQHYPLSLQPIFKPLSGFVNPLHPQPSHDSPFLLGLFQSNISLHLSAFGRLFHCVNLQFNHGIAEDSHAKCGLKHTFNIFLCRVNFLDCIHYSHYFTSTIVVIISSIAICLPHILCTFSSVTDSCSM